MKIELTVNEAKYYALKYLNLEVHYHQAGDVISSPHKVEILPDESQLEKSAV